MGWLSKILKGSTNKSSKWHHFGNAEGDFNYHDGYSADTNTPSCSEGHHNGNSRGSLNYGMPSTSGKDSDRDTPSSSQDSWSEQIEDIDLAIALSLAEADQGGKDAVNVKSQEDEDEKLAKALHESLNVESSPESGNGTACPPIPPHYRNGTAYPPIPSHYGNGTAYPPMPYYPMGYKTCVGCQNEIGSGRYLTCMNGFWHPECFQCHACNLPITDYEFSMSGKYPYHKSCYRNNNHPKCDVCKHFIPTNPVGLIEYRVHPFWMQKYCPSHEHDSTPRCCSCEQLEPQDTKYVALKDGRKLCLECLDSAIMDTNECQPLNRDILIYYESLNMKVEQYVPLLLVEREALNEARDGEKNGHHHMPETRGLCLSETQTISTVTRRPRFGARHQAMDMITEPYALTRHCEVTAILVLYGLPRLLTGSILAHEMMHAWLRLKGYPTLRPDVEEGICQVLAHMWLEAELMSASAHPSSSSSASRKSKRSPFDQKLGQFFKHQIESDPSPVYGGGFRAGQQAVQKYGLPGTLNHILRTGNFPY